jgi:hypothetical protein
MSENNIIKISVVLLVKNNEPYLLYLNNIMDKIKSVYDNYHLEFFFYENNSIDNTKNEVKNFFKNRNGIYMCKDISNNSNYNKEISISRGEYMCYLRNNLKEFHGKLNSDFVLLLDSNVVFLENTLQKMIDVLNNNKDISMVTPFGLDYNIFNSHYNLHYYDTFALIKNNIDYKTHGNSCLFNLCRRCKDFRSEYNITINENELFSLYDDFVHVNSAFAGFALLRTEIYNEVFWDKTICEHHSFCKKISEFGKIVIVPKIFVSSIDEYSENVFESMSENLHYLTKNNN